MDVIINSELNEIPSGVIPVGAQSNFYHTILTCLGYPDNKAPVADLLRLFHGLEGKWLIASPIHWQATHNDAMITASGNELHLSEEESRQLFDAFKAFVAEDNIEVYYHDAYTWLIQYSDKPPINAKPVHCIQHHSMMSELKNLDNTHFWQRFITESQMFFSSPSLNSQNVNGLWFWGGGALGPRSDKLVIYDDENLGKLARLLSTNASMYESSIKYTKTNVLLFNMLQQSELVKLQTQLQKNKVHWHWNNITYVSKPKRWWMAV